MSKAFEKKNIGIISKVEFKKTRVKVIYWAMFAILTITAAICLLPPLWILLSGFKGTQEFYEMTMLPRKIDFGKFVDTWNRFDFVTYYKSSLIQAAGEWVCCIVFNGLTGYVISRLKPRGSFLVMGAVLVLMLMPNTIGMVPLYKTIVKFPYIGFSMINTYWPLWIAAGANCFNILLFKNFFDTIPKAYIEAARIDGCTSMRIFFSIILPLSLPILVVVSIFSFNSSWNSFIWPYLILTENHLNTMSIFLFKSQAANHPIDSYMIMLIFSILPPTIIFIILQKQIIGGLSIGGVKG
ncbi:MAG: carbohydrate ABC transporter permease [Clostridia bacterium]|nr:carbohydrate ABC transporter permease [Clostridia bacterium]